MRKWAVVLHFYQPPTQDLQVTKTVLYSCYLPLLKMLERHEEAKITLNLTGSLMSQLGRLGAGEFFLRVSKLLDMGRVELVNCPVHHPVAPVTPERVVTRQLTKNLRVMKETLGVEAAKDGGVFLPELAVDEEVIKRLRDLETKPGYAVVDETAVEGEYLPVVEWQGQKLAVNRRLVGEVFRSYPARLEAKRMLPWVEGLVEPGQTMVSVNDAELFGHHYEERGELLDGILGAKGFEFVGLSEAVDQVSAGKVDRIEESTWQTNLTGGGPFDLWADQDNPLQQKYLDLGRWAAEAFEQTGDRLEGRTKEAAQEHLDQGWSSCHLYWLSNRPWWHPDLVEKGANNLVRCIRTLPLPYTEKAAAEEKYHVLLRDMWQYHWSGEVEKKYAQYNEERKNWLDSLPKLG